MIIHSKLFFSETRNNFNFYLLKKYSKMKKCDSHEKN